MPPLRILIAGLLPHDSGKTWFTAALIKALKKSGVTVAAYKPLGGFNAWHSYGVLQETLRDKILAGGDARTYHKLTGTSLTAINPLAYVTTMPDPTRFTPAKYQLILDDVAKTTALWRISTCQDRNSHFYSKQALSFTPPTLRRVLEEVAVIVDAEPADANQFYEELGRGSFDEVLEKCRERLEEQATRLLIIESFNNAVTPYRGLDMCSLDFYVVVAPGFYAVYGGEKVCRAVEVVGFTRTDKLLSALSRPLLTGYTPPATELDELASALESSAIYELLSASV